MDNLDQIVSEAQAAFAAISDPDALEQVKAHFLGKSGQITELLKGLGKLPPEEKKAAGAAINVAKTAVEAALNARREAIRKAALEARLAEEALDVTLPGRAEARGGLHPVTRTLERIEALFRSIGFEVADGPEIEEDFFNFTALNTPEDHPARSMHDTFYLQNPDGTVADKVLLRTHTSPIQARYMQAHVAKYGATGKNARNPHHCAGPRLSRRFRCDAFADVPPGRRPVGGRGRVLCRPQGRDRRFPAQLLRERRPQGPLPSLLLPVHRAVGRNRRRLHERPLEGRWLEIAGCGMVHPDVLRIAGIDPEKYTGFAFGFGPDRLTMLRYGVNDLRLFFEGDLRFLRQFA